MSEHQKIIQPSVKPESDRKEIKQLILDLTEKRVEDKFSDRNLDRELEKHKLLSGKEFSVKEVKDYIQSKARPYSPMFPLAYWREMFRLFGWPVEEATIFRKKRDAAIFNNEVIYGRFDKGVLLSLHVLNPYNGYMTRNFKHFQFLTEEGVVKLSTIINQAIEVMSESSNYPDFRSKWFEKYGVPYQLNLFQQSRV